MATRYDIVHEGAVPSTQDGAIDAFAQSGRATLVVADRQIAGRGRQGRGWIEPDRGMFSSLVFTTSWPVVSRTLIPLTVSVAVRRAIAEVADTDVLLKWPNDLLDGDRKAGGILVEASDDRIAIGCGINLWWAEPPAFATAIFGEDPGPDIGAALATRWVDVFLDFESAGPDRWPRSEYESSCVTLGSHVEWDHGSGTAAAIAANGGLVVDTAGGTVVIDHGDVHLTDEG